MNVTSAQHDPSLLRSNHALQRAASAQAPAKTRNEPPGHNGARPGTDVASSRSQAAPNDAATINKKPQLDRTMMLRRLAMAGENPAARSMADTTNTEPKPGSPDDGASPLTLEGLLKAWGTEDPMYDLTGNGTVGTADLIAFLQEHGTDNPLKEQVFDLLAAWGTDNPDYDLTGNGIVGLQDLLHLLSNGATPAETGETESNQPLTVDGLLAAWGTDDPTYDLTGNGTVGTADLMAFLQEHGTDSQLKEQVFGLLSAWGTDNPQYDLTGSGVVNIQDLLALLQQYVSDE